MDFGAISQRGQMAYALACIEAVVRHYDLKGPKYDEWLERAWRRTSSPKSAWREPGWPRNFAEIDDLLDPPVGGWGDGVSDVLQQAVHHARNLCEDLLEGRGAAHLTTLVAHLAKHGVARPEIEPFERSAASEMGGVGPSVPPAFFRRGIAREEVATHLAARLASGDVLAIREAAVAAAHVGAGSQALVTALLAARANDLETIALVDRALEVLAPEERSRFRTGRRAEERALRVTFGLASPDAALRQQAIEEAARLVDTEEFVCAEVSRLARVDLDPAIRAAAIYVIASCRRKDAVREIVFGALDDEAEEVRFQAARVLWLVESRIIERLLDAAASRREDARFLEVARRAIEAHGTGWTYSVLNAVRFGDAARMDGAVALVRGSAAFGRAMLPIIRERIQQGDPEERERVETLRSRIWE